MQPDPPGVPETREGAPAPPNARPAPKGLPPLALDAPPAMEVTSAFGIARAFENGWLALKHAPLPMLIAGFLMALLDGSNGGFNGPGGGGSDDYGGNRDYDSYSGLIESVGAPLKAAYSDVLGDALHPIAVWAQVGLTEVGLILGVLLITLICMGVVLLVMTVARSFVRPGVIRLHSHILQTAETDSFAVIFSGSDRFLHMLAWEFLTFAIVLAVTLVALLPGGALVVAGISEDSMPLQIVGMLVTTFLLLMSFAYFGTGLGFGAHLITLEGRTPLEALKRSWMLARGRRLWLVLFWICAWLLKALGVLVGLLMCCVGLLVTVPAAQTIIDFAFTESFLLLTRGEDITGYWAFWRLKEGDLPVPATPGAGPDAGMDARLDDELRRFDET